MDSESRWSAICASLLLIVALLPNCASAHDAHFPFKPDVLVEDLVPLLESYDQLKEETLPIVHSCTQVEVTVRAQDMTESELTTACMIMKETADIFHAKMQTDPASPLNEVDLEVLAFSDHEEMREYGMEVYGGNWQYISGIYTGSTIVLAFNRDYFGCCGPLGHEYVHYLDYSFNGALFWYGHTEGLATYLPGPPAPNPEDSFDPWTLAYTVGNGSNLPAFLDAWNDREGPNQYWWGYMTVRFLFEEHPQVIRAVYDLIRRTVGDGQVVLDYISDVLPPLTAEFHKWLRQFIHPTTVRQIEPITLFGADGVEKPFQEGRTPASFGWRHGDWAELLWRDYIQTSRQDVTVSVSLSVPYSTRDNNYVESEVIEIYPGQWYLYLYVAYGWHDGQVAYNTGTVDVTLTITAPDGNNAQSTFTVDVVTDLQSKEIVVHDHLSTEEGYATVDLSAYFTGPALEEVDFSAASSNPDVANVAVEDGRLVITLDSVGETQITVRGDYLGRIKEQTFAISVTDDCPSWLCKGSFTGWRTTLLRPATGSDNTQAPPETTDGR